MNEKMKITKERYYHVFALYIVASKKQKEVDNLEKEANDLLGQTWGSHLSDAIYQDSETQEEFDECLRKMDIEVSKEEE